MPRLKHIHGTGADVLNIESPSLPKDGVISKAQVGKIRKFAEECIISNQIWILYNYITKHKDIVKLTDIENTNCLYWCLQYNDIRVDSDFIIYLLKLGSDPGLCHIWKKNTPVHMACRRKWCPWYVVIMMVAKVDGNSLDLGCKDDYKKVPLHHFRSVSMKKAIMESEDPMYEAGRILRDKGYQTVETWSSHKYIL